MRLAATIALLCAASPAFAESKPCSKQALDFKVGRVSMGMSEDRARRALLRRESSADHACSHDPMCPKQITIHRPFFRPLAGYGYGVMEGKTTFPATRTLTVQTVGGEVYWASYQATLPSCRGVDLLTCVAQILGHDVSSWKRDGPDRLVLACKERRLALEIDRANKRYTLSATDLVRRAKLRNLSAPLPPGRALPTRSPR